MFFTVTRSRNQVIAKPRIIVARNAALNALFFEQQQTQQQDLQQQSRPAKIFVRRQTFDVCKHIPFGAKGRRRSIYLVPSGQASRSIEDSASAVIAVSNSNESGKTKSPHDQAIVCIENAVNTSHCEIIANEKIDQSHPGIESASYDSVHSVEVAEVGPVIAPPGIPDLLPIAALKKTTNLTIGSTAKFIEERLRFYGTLDLKNVDLADINIDMLLQKYDIIQDQPTCSLVDTTVDFESITAQAEDSFGALRYSGDSEQSD